MHLIDTNIFLEMLLEQNFTRIQDQIQVIFL